MTIRLCPPDAATLANECRRSCSLRSSSRAAFRIRRHGCSMFTRCRPAFSPQITYGLPSSRGMSCSTASEGGLRRTAFRPVLESGSIRQPCSSLTCSHCSVRISFRRAPVSVRRRIAAITQGEQVLSCSASRRASPSRDNSAWLRKRSCLPSRYFSTCRQGLEPSGLRPCFSAHPKNLKRPNLRLRIWRLQVRALPGAPCIAFNSNGNRVSWEIPAHPISLPACYQHKTI
jgi:hypothetical protein